MELLSLFHWNWFQRHEQENRQTKLQLHSDARVKTHSRTAEQQPSSAQLQIITQQKNSQQKWLSSSSQSMHTSKNVHDLWWEQTYLKKKNKFNEPLCEPGLVCICVWVKRRGTYAFVKPSNQISAYDLSPGIQLSLHDVTCLVCSSCTLQRCRLACEVHSTSRT